MEEIEGEKYIRVDDKTIILHSAEMPTRLTPTGKISYAKSRVYTQRYRKEWEQMSDFKDWLTSVPNEPTRAFCKYCNKDLHAHRLSLLKHMCTMKHQRSSLMYQNEVLAKQIGKNQDPLEGEENFDQNAGENEGENQEIEYAIDDYDEAEAHFPEHKYARDVEEESSENNCFKKIKLELMDKRDTLVKALEGAKVDEESVEDVSMDMEMVPETVETSEISGEIHETLSEDNNLNFVSFKSVDTDSQIEEDESNENDATNPLQIVNVETGKSLKKVPITITPTNSKTIVLTSTGKTLSFSSGKLNTTNSRTQYVLSKLKDNGNFTLEKKSSPIPIAPKLATNQLIQQQDSGTSQIKKVRMTRALDSPTGKNPTISTHVLDMGKGLPISGLQVSLYKLLDGRWTFVNECNTSSVGRCTDLMNSDKNSLTAGRYKLHFDVDKYFSLRKIETLYPFIEIVFDVKNPMITYHIPVLLSPFGYTTYRGMDK